LIRSCSADDKPKSQKLIKVTFLALSALALAYILCLGEKKISFLRFGSLKNVLDFIVLLL
jgi:hypothetical protein